MKVNFCKTKFVTCRQAVLQYYSARNFMMMQQHVLPHDGTQYENAREGVKLQQIMAGALMEMKHRSCVRGYHVYHNDWTPLLGEILKCFHEVSNVYNLFAIKSLRMKVFLVICQRK